MNTDLIKTNLRYIIIAAFLALIIFSIFIYKSLLQENGAVPTAQPAPATLSKEEQDEILRRLTTAKSSDGGTADKPSSFIIADTTAPKNASISKSEFIKLIESTSYKK